MCVEILIFIFTTNFRSSSSSIHIVIIECSFVYTSPPHVLPPYVFQAALHDVQVAAIFFFFLSFDADQAKCQVEQRAAAAQHLQALLVVVEPQL